MADFEVWYDGSKLFLLKPMTDKAKTWAEDNIEGDVKMGDAWVIEDRYLNDILAGLEADGLTAGD